MNQPKINIAIDGYSSCGKSTLAKQLSEKLGFLFVDTGAMYRAVTLFALQNELVKGTEIDSHGLLDVIQDIAIDQRLVNGQTTTFMNGENVEEAIRTNHVASFVSQIAAIKEVRAHLVSQQQQIAAHKGVVMDGRDIGTVVMPNAELKIFVTASHEVRTQRRFDELISKGTTTTKAEISANLKHRDTLDTQREQDPLRQADDAILLDNSDLTREEQLALVLSWVEEKQTA